MIDLKVNAESVDLHPDSTISLDEESPLFSNNSIPGGFGFPFNLPISARNRRIFDFPERVEKRGVMSTEQEFQLFNDGILQASGTIHVTEAGDDYRAYLKISNGDFAAKVKDKKLKDLTLGGTRTWAWKTEYKWPDDDFALFPVYNPNFADYTADPAFANNDFRINSFDDGVFYHIEGENYVISPFPFINYLVRQIFQENGFFITENILATDPDLRDLVLYSTWDISVIETTFELVSCFLGYDQYNEPVYEEVMQAVGTRVQDEWNMVDCLPDILISDFLLWLQNKFNLGFIVNRKNEVRIIKRQDLIMGAVDQDITDQVDGDPTVIEVIPPDGFKLTQEVDEDDTIFKDDWVDIENYLEYLKDPVANLTALAALEPDIKEVRYVESMDTYYQYLKAETEPYNFNWQVLSIGYQNYLSGNRKEEFHSGLSTMMMIYFQRMNGGAFIRCPYAKQQGNCIDANEATPFTGRLLFYRGIQNDSADHPVPYGCNDNLDQDGSVIAGKNLTLRYEGDYGLYEQMWKNYLTWYMSRKQVNLTISDPSQLEFGRVYAIDGKHFLLKKRTVTFSLDGVEPAECEFYLL